MRGHEGPEEPPEPKLRPRLSPRLGEETFERFLERPAAPDPAGPLVIASREDPDRGGPEPVGGRRRYFVSTSGWDSSGVGEEDAVPLEEISPFAKKSISTVSRTTSRWALSVGS